MGKLETDGAHSESHEVFKPIDLKAPQTARTTLSSMGTPVLFSTRRQMPAPAKFVHKITTASAPSFITSSDASEISFAGTLEKLKLTLTLIFLFLIKFLIFFLFY